MFPCHNNYVRFCFIKWWSNRLYEIPRRYWNRIVNAPNGKCLLKCFINDSNTFKLFAYNLIWRLHLIQIWQLRLILTILFCNFYKWTLIPLTNHLSYDLWIFRILFKMAPWDSEVTWGHIRSHDSPQVLPPCGSPYTPVIWGYETDYEMVSFKRNFCVAN